MVRSPSVLEVIVHPATELRLRDIFACAPAVIVMVLATVYADAGQPQHVDNGRLFKPGNSYALQNLASHFSAGDEHLDARTEYVSAEELMEARSHFVHDDVLINFIDTVTGDSTLYDRLKLAAKEGSDLDQVSIQDLQQASRKTL